MQQDLPIRQVPKTLQYAPAGEDAPPWIVGKWQELSGEFGVDDSDVVAWHLALAGQGGGQGRPWLVIRRIFNVCPLWGDGATADDIRAWEWKELAESVGVPEKHLRQDLEAAKEFWKKAKVANSIQRNAKAATSAATGASIGDDSVNQLDGLPDFQIHQDFTDDQIAAILTPFRFNESVRSQSDRLYVANRILELSKMLKDKHRREQARQLIVMELNMSNHEMSLGMMKSRMDSMRKNHELSDKQSSELRGLADTIANTEKVLTSLSVTYQKAADELGADEMEAGEVRRVALGTISHLIEAHREYYASGDKLLVDGMFTAEEVMWLTTPLAIRPAQYRPDVVLRMREASQPENLWGKDYEPTVIQRDACRRLLKLVQLLTDESEPEPIPGIDDPVSGPDDADAFPDEMVEAVAAPTQQQVPNQEYITPSSSRDSEPFMVVG